MSNSNRREDSIRQDSLTPQTDSGFGNDHKASSEDHFEGQTRSLARALEAEREAALREEGFGGVPYRGGYGTRRYGRRTDSLEEGGFDVNRLFAVCKRRRVLLLSTFFGIVALGIVYTKLQKPVYKAEGQMLVSTPGGTSSAGNSMLSDLLGGSGQSRSLGTQISLLQSAPVMKGAYKRLSTADQEQAKQYMRVDIASVPNAEVISVGVSAHNPDMAAHMVNAICDEYVSESRKQSQEQVSDTTAYVVSQLGPAKRRLDNASLALKRYQERNGTVDVGQESSARIAQAGQIESAQRDAITQREAASARLKQLQADMANQSVKEESSATIGVSPAAAALKAQITQLEINRTSVTREYTPQSREVRDLDRQLAELRSRLAKESGTSVSSRVESVNPIRQSLRQALVDTQAEIRSLDARLQALNGTAQSSKQKLEALPERSYRLGQLQLDQEVYQQAYKTLIDRYQQLRISEEANQTNAHMIARAEAPGGAISPKLKINLLASIFLGALLSLAATALAERLDTRLHSDEEVEDAADLPILAHVPFIRNGADQTIIGPRPKPTPALESYRMLRTNIEFASLDETLRSIVVTSSQPGEGKSLSSANLASVLALSGKNVILVDCDLRRPRQHDLFGLPNQVGFTSIVVDRLPIEQALQNTAVPGLRLLTSGPLPPNPPEILDSRAGQACLKELTEHADIVIIDTPPGLSMADAHIVAMSADAILIVVSAPDAGKREVMRTTDLLAQSGTRMLGVVLNKIKEDTESAYGYFGPHDGNPQLGSNGRSSNGKSGKALVKS